MARSLRAILFAALASTAPLGASAAADRSHTVTDAHGRVVKVLGPGGSARDVAPAAPEAPALAQPLGGVRTGGAPPRDATLAPPEAWPMFQGDARHTGYLPVSLDPSLFSLRWQKDVGGIYSLNPVSAGDGKVFVSLVTYFNDVTSLFALRSVDGSTLWSKGFGDIFSVNPPSYAYGNVYVQTGNHGDDTWLRAFNATTGAPVFQAPHEAQWERYFAPTVYDGKIYVNGGYYGGMYGFDALTGAQLFFAALPQYDQWTPAVAGGTAYAYLGEYTPGLYGKDRLTGAQVLFIPDFDFDWNGWSMNMAPVIGTHDDVIAIHDGRLISFDTAQGTIRWQVQAQFTGQPSLAHEQIYVINGNRLYVLDELTHAELWWWQPPTGTPAGPVIVTDSHALVSTASAVYAVDLTTGQSVWSYPAGGHLALADATLYIASADGMLTAITMAHVVPTAFSVHDPGGNGNAILEPGETAEIRASWRAGVLGVTAVTGSAVGVGAFTVSDPSATYGNIPAGTTVSCADQGDCYGVTMNGTRPATHWDVTLQETLSAGDRHDWRLHVGSSFDDVPPASIYYRFVETILHAGVTGGCAADAYCPTTDTARNQMAVFVLLSKEGAGYAPPACGGSPMFSDVPIPNPYCRWIEELARRGVVSGCGDGKYCPASPVTREQMAIFALRTLDPALDPPACGTPMFTDVPASSPYCKWIEELARRGVVGGCGGGKYCPVSPVTREQMAVFLTRTFGLTIDVP
jgi:outer membrane protein assembly factor BamB